MLPQSTTLAAIDLGSNSFRLEVGQVLQSRYRRQHCSKQMVSLGASLDPRGYLSREAIDRGPRCLRVFAAELDELCPARVRVVATQTLREARNREDFLNRAETILGLPVEVITGHEEARLIYAGVAFLHPHPGRRLVIDIGGRSTEMIVGLAEAPELLDSFRIGSASLAQRFFADGVITAARFRAAQWEVARVMQPALAPFVSAVWDEAMAASGTAGMLSGMLRANAITDGTVTPAGLRWLIERCIHAGHVERLDLAGLKTKRRKLLPGGLAILYTLLTHCQISRLQSAKGALRQGVIVDMHRTGTTMSETSAVRDQPESVCEFSQRDRNQACERSCYCWR